MLKKVTAVLMAAVMTVGMTACGNEKKDDLSQNSENSSSLVENQSSNISDVSKVEEVTEKRVVAGTVASAQYLDALGVDVVAVPTTEKKLPENYEGKPEIGLPMSPNLELILAQEPDVVVTDSNLKATIDEMFEGKDIEVILLNSNSYESIAENLNTLGEKLGLESKAEEVVAEIESKKAEAIAMTEGKDKKTVAIIFGTTSSFMLATENSCTGSIVKLLGATNVSEELGLTDAYVAFDREKLAELNPDVILRLSHADPEEAKKAFDAEFEQDFWQGLTAVQENKVYDLDTAYFGVTANFDTIDAPVKLAEILYGE